MAELRRIVPRHPLSNFRNTQPQGGLFFGVMAEAMNAAYDFLEPLAMEQARVEGDAAGRSAAKNGLDAKWRPAGPARPYRSSTSPSALGAGTPVPMIKGGPAEGDPRRGMFPTGAEYETPDWDVVIDAAAKATSTVESEGSGGYRAIGPVTDDGDQAYGKYQVMGKNVPLWTEKYVGKRMTPQQFLDDEPAQEAVFRGQFGSYLKKYGTIEDAASMWFSGKRYAGNNATDGYNTVPQYVDKILNALPGGRPTIYQDGSILPGFQKAPTGSIRQKPLSEQYQRDISALVKGLGSEYDITLISAGQDPKGSGGARTGSTRHDVDHTGHAHTSDFVLTRDGKPVTPREDPELYARFIEDAAQYFPGIGHYDWGIHVGSGDEAFWGPTTRAASADPVLAAAYERGRAKLGPAGTSDPVVVPPETVIRNNDGALEPRMYSPMSGPILQAHNAAAKSAIMAETQLRAQQDILNLSRQYTDNPGGFSEAMDSYIDQMLEGADPVLAIDLRDMLQTEGQRRYLGLLDESHRNTRQRANNSVTALAERASVEYEQALLSGREEDALAARGRLEQILANRESLPGSTWTRANSENEILRAQARASKAAIAQQKKVAAEWKDTIQDAITVVKSGYTSVDESILDNPEAVQAHPELAMKLAANIEWREAEPDWQATAPDDRAVIMDRINDIPIEHPFEAEIRKAMTESSRDADAAFNKDPMGYAQEHFEIKPPEMPVMSGDPLEDSLAVKKFVSDRVRYAVQMVNDGWGDAPTFFSEAEREQLSEWVDPASNPVTRAMAATSVLQGAGRMSKPVFDELEADKVLRHMAGVVAMGAPPALMREAFLGQQRMENNAVAFPTKTATIQALDPVIADALPVNPELRGQLQATAKALYAARYRGEDPSSDEALDMMRTAYQDALGQETRGDRTYGGVQEVNDMPTLLPPLVDPIMIERAFDRAVPAPTANAQPVNARGQPVRGQIEQSTGTPVIRGGPAAGDPRRGVFPTGAEYFKSEIDPEDWGGNGTPMWLDEPITRKVLDDAVLTPVPSSRGASTRYYLQMHMPNGEIKDVSNERGFRFWFDIMTLTKGM